VAVGYFAQDTTDSIAKGTTAIEWLHHFDLQASQEELPDCSPDAVQRRRRIEIHKRAFRR